MGEGKVDIMTNNTPVVLKDKNRAETVLISIFSYPNSEFKDENDLNLIFTSKPSLNNVLHSGRTAVTVGGYGLLFGWVLVASVLFYIIVYDKKRKDTAYYNAFLLLLFGSLFILPSGWWGRYVPFFYAFPLIILLYGESYRYKKWIRYFTNIMYFILAVDIIIAVPIAGGISLYKKKIVNDYIENFSELKEPVKIDFAGNTSFRLKLEKANVPYEEVPEEELDTTIFSPPIFVLSSQLFNKQSDETNN
ncbi:MAG: hypothetical protein ACLVKO_02800 [Dysgonomonas sp.]